MTGTSRCAMHLLLSLTLTFLLTQKCRAGQNDQLSTENLPVDGDEGKYNDNLPQNRNYYSMFDSYPAVTDSDRDNGGSSKDISLEESQFGLDDLRPEAHDRKTYLDSSDEMRNVYRPIDSDDEAMSIKKIDGTRAILMSSSANTANALAELQDPLKYISPLFVPCRSSDTNAMAACLAFITQARNFAMTHSDRRRLCVNSPSWQEFRRCLDKPRLPLIFDDSDFARSRVFNLLKKKNNNGGNVRKIVPFQPWGGKRFNQVGTEKVQASRVPFNAWGGKRQDNENNNATQCFEMCKRSKVKFHSWGGKRNERK